VNGYRYILLLHVLGATIWTGGHLVLATRILPAALRQRSAATLLAFEQRYEAIGLPALALQVATGVWLAWHLVPLSLWLSWSNPVSRMLVLKFSSLAITIAFALDARFRVLPRLRDDNIRSMLPHIITVTTLAVVFVIAGVGIRTGGWS